MTRRSYPFTLGRAVPVPLADPFRDRAPCSACAAAEHAHRLHVSL
jgi:hypothetical protein